METYMCGRFAVAEPDPNAFSFRFGFSYSDFENFLEKSIWNNLQKRTLTNSMTYFPAMVVREVTVDIPAPSPHGVTKFDH